jgi:hydrogenase expression/formation protein HypE
LSFETELISDVAPIHDTVRVALSEGDIHCMKDITRGGLSMALNEIAWKSDVSIWVDDNQIPVDPSVRAASEMLGLDPLEITCEGVAVIIVSSETADQVLAKITETEYGRDAKIIGEVKEDHPGMVLLRTVIGGTRILRKPLGEPIPRVC